MLSSPRPADITRSLVVTAVLALVLSGCSLLGGADGGSSTAATATASTAEGDLPEIGTSPAQLDGDIDPATDAAYADYYDQDVQWEACQNYDGMLCTTISVPKVWNDPSQGDITLALLKIPATGTKKGTLFMNPGGPGGSGVSFVAQSATTLIDADVRSSYDLVGFDPRGVGESDGITCLDDAQTDEYVAATFDLDTSEGLAAGTKWLTTIADACEKNSGDLLPYLDTMSAARDLDVMRAVVGSDTLDYLGYSYGTYLGSTYAELYPERTGKFVLDGAIDPTLTGDEMAEGQAKGFENEIHRFASWCLDQGSSTCPLTGDEDAAVEQIQSFFSSVDKNPLTTDDADRPLTGSMARSGVLIAMYDDGYWPYLAQALTSGLKGEGQDLLTLVDLSNDRDDSGHYSGNGLYAITAVNCLDHPAVEDEAWMKTESERLTSQYPTFGSDMGYSGLSCKLWPTGPVRKPAEIHASGSDLIVVIGTVHDPATPYTWAQALAKQLDNSTLITFEGDGHTAYGRSGGCVEDAVNAYLLDGTAPQSGLTCS